MRKRHPNYRRIKIHRNYTVEEAALQLNVHKNTVRSWIKDGLPALSDKETDIDSWYRTFRVPQRQEGEEQTTLQSWGDVLSSMSGYKGAGWRNG